MTNTMVEVLRATRFELNGTPSKFDQQLERAEVLEIRWPNGETDVMAHIFRVAETFPPGASADFWMRHTYQDYDKAVSEQRRIEERDGALVGEPVEFVKLGETVTIPWTDGTPEDWGRGGASA